MEGYVEDLLPSVIRTMDICKCKRCRMDIAAYALNRLPPKYVVTDQGHMFAKLESFHSQFDVDIIKVITHGASIIGANPKH